MSDSTPFGSGSFGTEGLGSTPFFATDSMINGILYVTGHSNPSTETTKRRQILQLINNIYQEIVFKHNWRWLYNSLDINFYGIYNTGTVDLTKGVYTVAGTDTVFDSTMVGGQFYAINRGIVYTIASMTSNVSFELSSKYSEDDETDVHFTITRPTYELPSDCGEIKILAIDNIQLRLIPLGQEDFAIMKSRDPGRIDTPIYYTLKNRDADDDSQYMEVYPAPDRDYNVHLTYSKRIFSLEDSSSSLAIIPDRFRVVLYYGALSQFALSVMKDVDTSAKAERDYNRVLIALCNDTQTTDQRMQLVPSRQYRTNRRRFRKGYLDRYNFGRFD